MKPRRVLSIVLTLAMLATVLAVMPMTTASATAAAPLYSRASWSITGEHNYLTASNVGITGGKYIIKFAVTPPTGNPCFYFDWRDYANNTKSGISSWNYKAVTGIYDDGSNDCLAIGTAPNWVKTVSRGGATKTYNYTIIWDTAAKTFDVTMDWGGSLNVVRQTATGSGTFSGSDVLKFASNSTGATITDLAIYNYGDVPDFERASWTVSGEHNYLMVSTLGIKSSGKYVIDFTVNPPTGNPCFYFDWRDVSNGNKSNVSSWNYKAIAGIYDDGSNDCLAIGPATPWVATVSRSGGAYTYHYSILWDTAAKTFDVILQYNNGSNKGQITRHVTGSGTFASNDVLKFASGNGATITNLSVTPLKEEIYTGANGWSLGSYAREQYDGSLWLAKGISNAASFTPNLQANKIYEITYDVSGLYSDNSDAGRWFKSFALSMTAGGQTEENVLTYRLGGGWRNATTDEGYGISGSNGQNKIIINTGTGEWEAWALGVKNSYSGYTSNLNNATKSYHSFANLSDFTLKFYAQDTGDGYTTPCISNVQVREATELSTSKNGDYFYLDLDRSFTTGHKYKISFNAKPATLAGSKDVFVDVTGGNIAVQNSQGQAFGLLYVYDSGNNALGLGDWGKIGKISDYKSSVLSDGIDMDIVWDTALGTSNVTVIISGREYNFAWNPGVIAANQTYGKLKIGGDTSTVTITDLSVTEVTPAPTEVPTEAPTEAPTPTPAPTEEPTEAPVAPVVDMGSAKSAANSGNAFYYLIDVTLNDGTATAFTVKYFPADRDESAARVQTFNISNISGVAAKLASVLKDIPEAQAEREITGKAILDYSIGGNAGSVTDEKTATLNATRQQ